MLYFYPKDMTTGCTTEACSFRDNMAGVRKLGAKIVGVSADAPESHEKFTGKYELNFRCSPISTIRSASSTACTR